MERTWIIASALCLLVATAFYLRGNIDATFVAATLGAVAWFISLRIRLRAGQPSEIKMHRNAQSDKQGDDVDEK